MSVQQGGTTCKHRLSLAASLHPAMCNSFFQLRRRRNRPPPPPRLLPCWSRSYNLPTSFTIVFLNSISKLKCKVPQVQLGWNFWADVWQTEAVDAGIWMHFFFPTAKISARKKSAQSDNPNEKQFDRDRLTDWVKKTKKNRDEFEIPNKHLHCGASASSLFGPSPSTS